MTEMQREMQNRISQEELDRAFDARFPKKMQEKWLVLAVLDPILR